MKQQDIQREQLFTKDHKVPKVSLILTTYNSEDNLKTTLNSIEMQDYPAIEVNIKDGGSTDRTLSIIEQYAKDSKYVVQWQTGADKGLYDAMNQGYGVSTGDVIVCFNDRFMAPDVVTKMIRVMEENPDCVGVHADLVYATEDKVVRYWKMGPQKSLYLGWMPGHPTLFLKRKVYETYGLYDDSFRIAADYEFMIRFLKDKENKLAYLPETIISMYYGGVSTNTTFSYIDSLKEGHRALHSNGVRFASWIDLLRTCRVLLQFVMRE